MKFITRIVPIILLAVLISGCGTAPGIVPGGIVDIKDTVDRVQQ